MVLWLRVNDCAALFICSLSFAQMIWNESARLILELFHSVVLPNLSLRWVSSTWPTLLYKSMWKFEEGIQFLMQFQGVFQMLAMSQPPFLGLTLLIPNPERIQALLLQRYVKHANVISYWFVLEVEIWSIYLFNVSQTIYIWMGQARVMLYYNGSNG